MTAAASGLTLALDGRWLVVDLGLPHRALGWAIVGGGLVTTRTVAWHQVDDDELPCDADPAALLRARMAARDLGDDAVGLLTSRDVGRYVDVARAAGGIAARCIATVGLSNALRAGDPPVGHARAGTINVLCHTSVPLTTEAALECLALAAEARALAVLEARVPSIVSGVPATGTGTDCIVIASPAADGGVVFAGKHTPTGHVVGLAVADAVRAGVVRWQAECAQVAR